MKNKSLNKRKVLVYGAGEAGKQLVNSLKNNPEFKVIGFLDDNKKLQKKNLQSKKIYPLNKIEHLIKNKNVNLIFLAMPSISRNKKSKIIKKLNKYKLIVKTLPSISQIIDGRVTVSDIKDFNTEDLLNRDQVKPDINC